MKTTVHIISHSHWDREWYMPFEKHRMKLLELMDTAMELFETDEEFHGFHLDGQTIVLDDYLEIKPQNREKLEKYIQEGKFSAGPWYVLQDEFFTSGESNIRNLLTGMRDAAAFGKVCRIGYFPDAFGNVGQMPQILKQAGMEAVVFGRGVKPVGADNKVLDCEKSGKISAEEQNGYEASAKNGKYESLYSEMNWESPDGSALPGILFANWYNNAMEIPTEPAAAKLFWDKALADAQKYAGTSQLLLMNGCDHQPVQRDLSAAIETACKLYPDIEFVHSDFETYVNAVKAELKCEEKELSTVHGELTSQETDGLWTLVNTSSSWIDLKQMNRACEIALEREAEPMAAIASLLGKEYPEDLLRYSWKKLMQNHPHDSICGCSVDAVNAEMKTRFEKSRQVAKAVFEESMEFVAQQIAASFAKKSDRLLAFAVFNTTGWARTGVVTAELDYERCYGTAFPEQYKKMEALALPELVLIDCDGERMDAKFEDAGVAFGYDLPDDRFRQPYMARKVRVAFEAEDVPAMGYRTYFVRRAEDAESERNIESVKSIENVKSIESAKSIENTENNGSTGFRKYDGKSSTLLADALCMENNCLRVQIHDDGSYTVTEKATGKEYRNIGYYEETGDVGNEYIYIQDKDHLTFTTRNQKAEISLLEDNPYRVVYQVKHILEVPESADDEIELVRRMAVDIHTRKVERSTSMMKVPITTLLTLERHAAGLKVQTTIENAAKDHRIRVMIPTGLQTEHHMTDSVFEVAKRNNRHSKNWKNPCGCEHQQNFTAVSDGTDGILVANFGLYEYEILPDQENTIAVTLLRCTGELGDWGVFPTPGAQMQGTYTLNYEIVPFKEEERLEAYREAYQFQSELTVCQLSDLKVNDQAAVTADENMQSDDAANHWNKKLPLKKSFLRWSGRGLNLTGFKKYETSHDLIARWVNLTGDAVTLELICEDWMKAVYRSNVIEENLGRLEEEIGAYRGIRLKVKPYEIVTLGIEI